MGYQLYNEEMRFDVAFTYEKPTGLLLRMLELGIVYKENQ